MKVYGSKIKHFTFIKPANETVATINDKNILQVWDVLTGEIVNIFNIHIKIEYSIISCCLIEMQDEAKRDCNRFV